MCLIVMDQATHKNCLQWKFLHLWYMQFMLTEKLLSILFIQHLHVDVMAIDYAAPSGFPVSHAHTTCI